MNPRTLSCAAAAAAVLTLGDVRAQTLNARLDRNPIHDDETVHLIVEAETQAGGAPPDLTPLHHDFEILGQSTSTHVTIENGAPERANRVENRAGPHSLGGASPSVLSRWER